MSLLTYSPAVTLTCSFLFIPVCTGVFGLRLYTRRKQEMKMGWDDWTMIPAWLSVMALQLIMIIFFALKKIGYPDPYPMAGPLGARPNLPLWVFGAADILALGFTKISVLFFFRRLFGRHSQWFKTATAILIAACVGWTVGFFFAWIFICGSAPYKFWQSIKIELASCVSTRILEDAFATTDVFLDLAIVVTPIPSLWALQMSIKKKVLVTGVFSLAAVTLLASVARVVIMFQAVRNRFNHEIDYVDLITGVLYWSMIEAGIGLIAANLIVIHGSVTKQMYRRLKTFSTDLAAHLPLRTSKGSRSSSLQPGDIEAGKIEKTQVIQTAQQLKLSDESIRPQKVYLYRKQGQQDVSLTDSFCADREV